MNPTDATGAGGAVPIGAGLGSAPGDPPGHLTEFLESIGAGVCVWDANLRLVAWNTAYRKIQAIPDDVLKPGARLAEILDNGPRLLDDVRTGEELEANARKALAARGGLELDRLLADGRIISVTYDAFADGCWIALYHDVTERRNDIKLLRISERELRLQRAQLDASLDSMPYGFSIWDDDYRLVLCNRRYAETYDLPRERVRKGVTLLEVCELSIAAGNYPGTTPDALYRLYRKRLNENTEPSVPGRYEMVVRDRTIRSTFIRAADIGWVVTHEDITEDIGRVNALRAREAELEREKLRLEAAVNNMSQGLCMFDAGERLVISNQKYADMYGLPEELVRPGTSHDEILAYRLTHGIHPADGKDAYLAKRKEIVAARQKTTDVVDLQDGRVLFVTHAPMDDGGWVATHEDITERVAHVRNLEDREKALAHQNMRFAAAVDNMSQGLCMFDANSRLVICNSTYARIYGLPPELVQPGTTLKEILAYRYEHGIHPVGGKEAYFKRREDLGADRTKATDTSELQDGRVISILHQPMEDGGWVSTHQDITEQRQTEARIHHLARHDTLTDLPNRLKFGETMEAAEHRIERRETLAIIAIDLDHFKMVNDTLGHGIGDSVLRKVGERLRACCRQGDEVSRLGGDEFAILTGPLDDGADAAAIADRVVKQIAEPLEVDGHSVLIGASVGIAVAPGDGLTSETLLKNADLALYRAKNDGRGAYHFFEKGMDATLQERRALELGLRQALVRGEFRLVFQPLFNLEEGRICCLEALLRWYHPERGTIPPNEFIPIAEDTGLIVAIGEWVLHEACRAAATWPKNVRVAVNLSTVQFRNRNLFQHIKAALDAAGLEPERLELEVTESLLLANVETTLITLHQLRQLGVRISMDDFGTGYSSLSYLRSFPFDKIKIDQSFVRDLSAKEDSRAIVTAVIGLGRSLGMSTTAEGVETEAQLNLVREQGCTEVQGFLFSPPLPGSAITKLFAETAGMEEWTRTIRKSG